MSTRVERSTRVLLASLPLLWITGCGQAVTEPATTTPSTATTEADLPDAATAVDLRVAGVEEYQELLETYRGQVVLVDFWATWCLPCAEQFPHTVKLARELGPQGLVVVGVSMNEVEEKADVAAFLERHEAPFVNLLSSYGGGSEAVEEFDLPGSLPYYRVYDRSGHLRHEFGVDPLADQQFTPEDIDQAIEELL